MDFLKKKMKELLDDDDKKPEKKPEGTVFALHSVYRLLTHHQTHTKTHPTPRQAVHLTVSAAPQTHSTTKALPSATIMHHNSMHRKATAILHKDKATHHKVKAILPKAILNSRPTATVCHQSALQRPWAHPHQCPLAGYSNLIKAASGGTMLNKQPAVHNGTHLRIFLQARMRRRLRARRIRHPVVTTREDSLVTLMDTRGTTILRPATRRTRRRRRRTRATPPRCLQPQVSAESQPARGSDTN